MIAGAPPRIPAASSRGALGRALQWIAASGSRAYASLTLLSGFLLFYRLGVRGLFEPDEGRYAEIPREMIARADWLTPHLNFVPYFEKPPLVYWMTGGLYHLIGEHELAVRLPSAVFTFMAVLATAYFGRPLLGRAAGWLGAAILATSVLPVWFGRIATLDAVLAGFVTLSIFSFRRALDTPDARKGIRDAWLLSGYVTAALGTLVKGPVGAALPGLVIGLHLILRGRFREVTRLRLLSGAVIYLAVASPWFILVSRANPGFAEFFFLRETLGRYLTTVHKRTGSVFFYFPVLLLGFVPWSFLLPRALYDAWRERKAGESDAVWFLAIWAASVFLFFSFAGSKLPGYVLPLFPPLALLVARTLLSVSPAPAPRVLAHAPWLWISVVLPLVFGIAAVALPWRWIGIHTPGVSGVMRGVGVGWILFGILALLALRARRPSVCLALLAAWVVLPHPFAVRVSELIEGEYSVAPIARASAERLGPEDLLVDYRGYAQGLPFYFRRRVVLYRHIGELYEGFRHLAPKDRNRWFITEVRDLQTIVRGPGRVFVLSSWKDIVSLIELFPELTRVSACERYVLFSNRPLGGATSVGTTQGSALRISRLARSARAPASSGVRPAVAIGWPMRSVSLKEAPSQRLRSPGR